MQGHGGGLTSGAMDFTGVDTWIFDLDNTLYPVEARLFAQTELVDFAVSWMERNRA